MSRLFRSLVICGLTGFAVVTGVSGQARQSSPAPANPMEELLVEVRALRADINRASAASMRGQLLGMRLQLQEQRISGVARQLADVQQRLRDNEQARSTFAAQLKMFEGNVEEKDKKEFEHVMAPLKAHTEQLEKNEEQLKTEEAALLQQLADEQSRWSRFNVMVEELEKAVAKSSR